MWTQKTPIKLKIKKIKLKNNLKKTTIVEILNHKIFKKEIVYYSPDWFVLIHLINDWSD